MSDDANARLARYRSGAGPLPGENLAWQMYGAGIDNFGKDDHAAKLPIPDFGSDELLSRVDAIGLCFSDIKLISQGSSHPRISGRDLIENPVIPGHEVSLTIVGVGRDLQDRFSIGQRYVVQADIYYGGVNLAYGYALPGGMQQFGILGKEILEGDEGCYLLPVKPETGYAEAALTEPWACVVASYRIKPRRSLKDGGIAVFVGPPKRSRYRLPQNIRSKKVILSAIGDSLDRSTFGGAEIVEVGPIIGPDLQSLVQERTGEQGFDDIIILGRTEPELIEHLSRYLAKGGILDIVSDEPMPGLIEVDAGRLHYDRILYTGANKIEDGYIGTPDSELVPGGAAWFVGAGGPMGQMHVERAVAMKNGPSRILATDVDTGRLEILRSRIEPTAERKGIKMVFLNPMEAGEEAVESASKELTDGRWFDDIVILAPVPALIEQASRRLADGGKLNVFAGVPRGAIAKLDLSPVYMNSVRWLGSSGSKIGDLRHTLSEAESGNLPTNRSVAAIGGIETVKEGVKAVRDARFPGKTVIFPQVSDLPLVALPDLRSVLPNVYDKLEDGRFWTCEAEEELLKEKLP